MARVFSTMTLAIVVAVLASTLIVSSTACMRNEDIDKEQQWACWNLRKIGGGYTSPNKCCSATTCECDETGNYTSNARFGRDCKCVSANKFVDEYYAGIVARQQEQNVTELNKV